MAAADDTRRDADETEGRLGHGAGNLTGDRQPERDSKVDQRASGIEQNVDRVADKVKGLLRSRD